MAGLDVVLLHGWMLGPAMWAHQEEALAGIARPHAITQPGHGVAVARLRQEPTIQDWVAWLDRELEGRGVGEAVFVAHGMGGVLAQELWRHEPRRVQGLVFVAALDDAWLSDQRRQLGDLCDLVLDWSSETAARVASALIGSRFLDDHPEWVDDWHEQVARTYDLHTASALGRLAAAHDDYRENSASIRVPTLVLHGSADGLVPAQSSRAMAERVPKAEFVEISDCGHAPPLERPEPVTEALVEFTAKL